MAAKKKSGVGKSTAAKDAKASQGAKASPNPLSTSSRNKLNGSSFAFPKQRKEPLEDASHVRNAIARFDQVKAVTDAEREQAFRRIKAAAKKFGVEMDETNWKQLGRKPHTANSAKS